MPRPQIDAFGAPPAAKAVDRGRYDRTLTQDERRTEQRRRLLDAAAHVFAKEGVAGASVDHIIARAGMGRRTFYDHFSDTQDAFVAVYNEGARVLFEAVEATVRSEVNPLRQLWAGISGYVASMQRLAPLARVLYGEARAGGPLLIARQEATRRKYVAMWQEGLRAAAKSGAARRVPDEVTIYALTSAAESVALRYIDLGKEAEMMNAVPAIVGLVVCAILHTDDEIAAILRPVMQDAGGTATR